MEKLINTQQVAEMLGVKPITVKLWRVKGQGPRWKKVGAKAVRYSVADVQAFLEQSDKAARTSSTLRTTK
jgi:predicted DNA-binding transcriptional regulator AlpA